MSQQAERRVGTVIGGKWRVDALLGSGSMAAVFAATHRNGARAALKILHAALCADRAVCERFLGEGYLANSVKHAGVVRCLDDGVTDDGCVFLTMDLLEGDTLEALRQKRGGRIPVAEAVDIGDKLLDVLGAVHTAGIIHRDLKPQNVFVCNDDAVKLLDFGIARTSERTAQSGLSVFGHVLGTPSFMSPEQALGTREDIDHRTDIWSLGATLFTALTGETVHLGPNMQARLLAAASSKARSIAMVLPDLPGSIAAAIDAALRFRKEDRWQSAEAMRRALREARAIAGLEQVAQRPAELPPRLESPMAEPAPMAEPPRAETGRPAELSRPFEWDESKPLWSGLAETSEGGSYETSGLVPPPPAFITNAPAAQLPSSPPAALSPSRPPSPSFAPSPSTAPSPSFAPSPSTAPSPSRPPSPSTAPRAWNPSSPSTAPVGSRPPMGSVPPSSVAPLPPHARIPSLPPASLGTPGFVFNAPPLGIAAPEAPPPPAPVVQGVSAADGAPRGSRPEASQEGSIPATGNTLNFGGDESATFGMRGAGRRRSAVPMWTMGVLLAAALLGGVALFAIKRAPGRSDARGGSPTALSNQPAPVVPVPSAALAPSVPPAVVTSVSIEPSAPNVLELGDDPEPASSDAAVTPTPPAVTSTPPAKTGGAAGRGGHGPSGAHGATQKSGQRARSPDPFGTPE